MSAPIKISSENIYGFRQQTYHLLPAQNLKNIGAAAEFVQERGFVYFWPIKGVIMPSLWMAAAGDRPVASAHDDPGHITWGWKDESLGRRIWYYGKILRKKATMIALNVVPYFYALSENYGNPAEDVLIQYHEGRLPLEAKSIFDALLQNGPLDTVSIRRKTNLTAKETNAQFDRAIALLQAEFKILPIGISNAGGWRYAFIYDLVHRHHPEILDTARNIQENQARKSILELYFRSVGAVLLSDIKKLFGWAKPDIQKTLEMLIADQIISQAELGPQNELGFGLRELAISKGKQQ